MSDATPIRVLVVDDHSIVREGIRHVLGEDPRFDVVGEAASGREAVLAADILTPDVVVLDISMPGGSGLDAAGALAARHPELRILMLSVHDDAEYVIESVRAGAHGYARKDSTPAELREAIVRVHAGKGYFSPALASRHAEAHRGAVREAPGARDVLTARELETLVHIAQGLTNREIGVVLGISTRTVEAHRDALMRKLEVRTVAGLTRLVLDQGLDRPPTPVP